MTTYIVLFRGINVGGSKVARMETLRKALQDAGFGGVQTYIQSGNVVLTSSLSEGEIASTIEKLFLATFGFASRPTVRSEEAWHRVIEKNPFPDAAEGRQVHAVVLDAAPKDGAIEALRALASTEQLVLEGSVLFLYTPDGFGRSKVAEQLDRLLNVPWTARNWNTVRTLQEMAAKAG